MHYFLCQHPNISGGKKKELDFFNYDLQYQKGLKYYHDNFNSKGFFKKDYYIDSSPSYLNDELPKITASRIFTYNSKAKIICLVRDPIARAYSAWNMYKSNFNRDIDWWRKWVFNRKGKDDYFIRRTKDEINDFDLFIASEIEAIRNNNQIEAPVLSSGLYAPKIKVFNKFFKDNIIVISNEEFNNSTVETLQQINDFLGVKRYEWDEFGEQKIFKQQYKREISKLTIKNLKDYYYQSNFELANLTGINYND